jgi:hypothetical protein
MVLASFVDDAFQAKINFLDSSRKFPVPQKQFPVPRFDFPVLVNREFAKES